MSDAGRRGEVNLKKLGSPDTVLAVEVVGKLEKDDYQGVLVPGLRQLLEAHGCRRPSTGPRPDAQRPRLAGGTVAGCQLQRPVGNCGGRFRG